GDGTYGLLHSGRFGERIERELPLYDVGFIFDGRILSALFRDYTFLASAYLLEPCDIQFRLARNYGLARRILPANIAVPLETIAMRLNSSAYLEHSMSFTFYNYRKKEASRALDADNIEPIRRFSGCDAEHNYIVGHVAAGQHTGSLVSAALDILQSVKANSRSAFDSALQQYTKSLTAVNEILSKTIQNTGDYASFRTFLHGCDRNQPMFSQGVLYEGTQELVSPRRRQYLGVAQSSNPIASLNTHLFQLSNLSPRGALPCTNGGVDSQRPENYQAFMAHISAQSQSLGVQMYALASATSAIEYLAALDQVLVYRHRQWANLRDSIPPQQHQQHQHQQLDAAFQQGYFEVQTRHLRDVAELVHRTHANTDVDVLAPELRIRAEGIVHRAEMVRRSLNRVIADPAATAAAVAMGMAA
ncbi:hypothetical protein GGI04_004669, partial [Coemansia thaxteri]